MINVVVAEDKHPILRSIVKKIEDYSPDLRIVGEFTDGISALQMIKQVKPHIVFTDIRMPGMDGLKLISEVKEQAPDTIFIIISGYGEFDYARQAMQLGVTEYLLKPVTQKSIFEVLDKAVQRVTTSRQTKEYHIFSHAIKSWNNTSQAIDHGELPYDSYFIMLICAGTFSKFLIDVANPLHDFWLQTDLSTLLNSQFPDLEPFWVLDGQAMNEAVVVFSCSHGNELDFQTMIDCMMEKLPTSGVPLTVAISNQVSKIPNLKLEYQMTRAGLQKYMQFGKSSVVIAKDAKLNSPNDPGLEQAIDEQKLVSLVKLKKRLPFFTEIESIMARWKANDFTQSAIEASMLQIISACSRAIVDKRITDSDLKLELDEIISISKDYPSLLRNVSFLFENFFLHPGNSEPNPNYVKEIMEQVDSYLQAQLSAEISINDIADRVNLNVSYLSREFKKYKGIAPIEYLTQIRIDKAKQLLTDDSNLMFKDIATLVGYSNQYYFSKVFKFITGLTPTEYKKSFHKESNS
ncbi:HTH-type transcriptional activator RhaR [Paenibacillus allorhizoplanae]|uniref:HTH-type transcriptional activator RhaR n=1 Tax=Paenibacillus allorhizoplanae TaxID=2905648 RepID=A0ABN8G026_9BACL|nr:response regulator [Paenibacillus allorhizoplanae]CAH1193018.1 HTH-type transcriptional activator RhaR [Paenibacillus allorhizoplanae]